MGCPSILFVDDDVMTQWVMTEVLSRSGYTVTSVCRCEDAIELLGDASEFDLLLVDLDLLDGLDGSSLITQWRKAAPGRAAIFTSVLGFPLRRLNRHEHFMHRPFSGCSARNERIERPDLPLAWQLVRGPAAAQRAHQVDGNLLVTRAQPDLGGLGLQQGDLGDHHIDVVADPGRVELQRERLRLA